MFKFMIANQILSTDYAKQNRTIVCIVLHLNDNDCFPMNNVMAFWIYLWIYLL